MSQRRSKRRRQESRAQAPQQPARRRTYVALVAVAAVALAVVAGWILLARGAESGPAVPPAQDEAGKTLELSGTDPITGGEVSLASFAGKPVVINIWASWCTGCAAEARALATFARMHPDAQVIGIDIQDTKAGARDFYRRFGWPSIFDPTGELAASLGLQGLPTSIFLDSQHREVTRIVGETDLAGFTAGFEEASSG